MDKEQGNDCQYSLEEILLEFSDNTSTKKSLHKEEVDDISVPNFVNMGKSTKEPLAEQPPLKDVRAQKDSDSQTKKGRINQAVAPPEGISDDVKIYTSSKKEHKKIQSQDLSDIHMHTPEKNDSENIKNHSKAEKKAAKQPKYMETPSEDYEDYEKKEKRKPPYDFICKQEDDFTLGAKHCSKQITKYTFFSAMAFFVTVIACFISFIGNFTIPQIPYISEILKLIDPFKPLILLICHLVMLLLSIEIIVSGLYRLILFSPTLDSVVAVHSIIILAHNIYIILTQRSDVLPFTAISSFVLLLMIKNKRARLVTLKRNYTAAVLSTTPIGVKLTSVGKQYTACKTTYGAEAMCKKISQASLGDSYASVLSPFLIVLPFILAVFSCKTKGSFDNFFFDYAALSALSFSFGFISSSCRAEYKLGKKLFSSGTSFVDTSQIKNLMHVKSAIVTDNDVFPSGSVEITGLKVVGNHSIETILSYATAMFEQTGGGAYKAFFDISKTRYVPIRHASNIHFYESGGTSANISQDNVLFGNAGFLMRMGVNITHGINIKNNVFMAINSSIAAVFTMQYNDMPNIYQSFKILKHYKIRPVLSALDFQITPMLTEYAFDLNSDFIVYPDVEERIIFSNPSYGESEAPVALLSRDNLHSFSEVLAFGKVLYKTTKFNTFISCLSSSFGIFLMYFLVSHNEIAVASPYNVFLYLFLWYLPVVIKNISS